MKNLKSIIALLVLTVFSVNVWGETTEELTSTELKNNITNTTCAYSTSKTYTDGTIDYVFYVYTDANSRPWMQLKKDKGVYIKITAPEAIKQVVVKITSATNSSGGVTDITKHTAYSGRLALLESDAAGSAEMTGVAFTDAVSNNIMTLTPSGTNKELYLKVSTGARIWGITVTYGSSCTPGTDLSITSASSVKTGKTIELASTGGNGGTVKWSVENGTGTASISNGILTAGNVGTVTVKAHQDLNGSTCETDAEQTVTITPITFTDYITECSGDPEISVNLDAVDGLGYVYGSAASESIVKDFTVVGGNLSQKVTVTAPIGFEVKSEGAFADKVELTPSAAGLINQKISVRLSSGKTVNADGYTGNVTIHSAEIAEDKTVVLSATVTPAQLTTPEVTATPGVHQITLSWNEVLNASSYQLVWNGGAVETVTSPVTKTDLTGGQSYSYSLVAVGTGNYSNSEAAASSAIAGKETYTVKFFNSGSELTELEKHIEEGATFGTLPTLTESCDPKSTTFVGWTSEEAWDGKVASFDKFVTSSTSVNAAMTLNAVWAEETVVPSEDFTQVTSLDNVTDGNYVISYTYNSTTIILKNETSSQTELKAISQSPSSSKYTNPNEAYVWELKKENGNYSVYNASVKKYLNATSSGLTLSETPTYFTLSYNSGFYFNLTNATNYYLSGFISGSNYTFQTTTSSRKLYLYKQGTTIGRKNYITTCSSDPLIEVSETELSGFSTIATTGNPSAAQSFTVEGYNLTEGITVSASTGYEVSSDNSNYSKSLSLTQTEGKVTKTTVYVRLAAATEANDNVTGDISLTSTDATTKNVALTGEVIAAVTVTFNNNGTTTDAPAAIKLGKGGTLGSNLPGVGTMTAPISGYTFVGWVADGDKWNGFTPSLTKSLITGNEIIDTDITYDAVWAKSTNDFELMGNSDPFTDGNYIITYYLSYYGLQAMGNVVSGSNITTIEVDDQDEGIIANNTEAKVVWTLHKTGTNTVTFYNADKGQYLQGTSSALSFTNTPVDWTWSMTPGEEGYAPKYKFSIGTNGLYYLSNEFQYHSSPDPLYIYKQQISNFFVTIPDEYTVIWHKGNAGTETSSAFEGQTFADIVADAPSVDDIAAGDCANTFMGWATEAIEGTDADGSSVQWAKDNTTPISGNVEYYAVFAYKEGGSETKSYGFEDTDDASLWVIDGPTANTTSPHSGSKSGKINTNDTYVQFKNKVNVTSFSYWFTRSTDNNNYNVYIETSTTGEKSDWTAVDTKAMSTFNSNGSYSSAVSKVFDGNTALYVRFHCSNTTATRYVDDISITYGNATYSNYVTQCTPRYDVNFYTDKEKTQQHGTTQKVEEGSKATAPENDPSKAGATFAGWFTENAEAIADKTITEATDFIAKWNYTAPTITEQPQGGEYTIGSVVTLVVVAEPITDVTFTYQWQRWNGSEYEDIAGATIYAYTAPTNQESQNTYRCVVTNGDVSTPSNGAQITVRPASYCAMPTIRIDELGEATAFIREATVTMECGNEGATIYYTTDGSDPREVGASPETYTVPFTIDETKTIRAYATATDLEPSSVQEKTFYKATLQSIAVETEPKKEYTALETFDPTDLVITATYNYDLSEDVEYAGHEDKFEFSPNLETKLIVGDDKVTITWGEKTIDQKITVNCIAMDVPAVETSKQGSTGITLTWSAVDNAASYQVKWNGGDAETPTYNTESSKYEFVKSGLTANTSYTYEVIAVGETNYCTSTTGEKSITTNKKSCESIDNAQIAKNPTDFYVGESIEPSQFTVDKHYDNGDVVTEAPSKAEIEGVTNPLTDAEVGTQTVTLTFNNKTTTIEITVKPQPVVTWSINGNEDNKQSFAYNAALVLPEDDPSAPQSCAEKKFVGWTTEAYKDYDADDAPAVLFTEAGDRKVTEDVTYYAVFAMVENAEINTVLTEVFDDNQTTDSNSEFDKNTFSNFNGNCSKAYKSQYGGIKLGSGSALGYITSKELDLSKPTTITFDVKQYDEDEKSVTVTIVNNENQSESVSKSYSCTTDELETAVLNFDASYTKAVVKITTTSSSHRIYVDNVKIEVGGEIISSAYSTKCAARTPEKIEITHEATKTFDVNDEFTSEGLEITASYNTGDPQVVTDYCTITAPDMTTAGEKDINISYTENNVTVYTSYKIDVRQPYYVMYDPNGATTGSAPSDANKYYTGEKVTVLANESLVKTNNVFKGWSYAGTTYQADEQVTVGTEDITLTAVWEEKMPCTITLSENGNTSTVTDKFTGDTYNLPTTITNNVDGYAFMGWSTQEIDDPVATTEPGTFFAKGEEITLTESAYTFYAVYARTSGTSSDYNAGKVTTDADIVAGGLYIIEQAGHVLSSPASDKKAPTEATYKTSGLSTTESYVWTLETSTNGFYLKNMSDNKYLKENGGDMSSVTSNMSEWKFAFQTAGYWKIYAYSSNRFLGFNSANTYLYKAYGSGNYDLTKVNEQYAAQINIYRLVGGYTTAPTIVVNGTTVQTVPANFHGNVIVEEVGDVTLNAATTWKNLTIKNGGKVTTNAALSINNLLIETKMGAGNGKVTSPNMKGASGQLIIGEGGSVTASGSAIIENQIDPTGTATQGWYSFSVPFPVSAQNGIYFGDAKLTNGVDYAIMEYLGDVRAQGQYGWKKYSGILQPGKMYVIAVTDSDFGKLRFKKTADGALVANNEWQAGIYGGGEDANWNAIGNPNLAIAQFVNNSGASTLQLYDHANNTFTVHEKGDLNIVVGSGFFIQAVEGKETITMKVNETSGRGYRAPAEEAEEKPFVAIQLLQGEAMSDQVFLNADVNATLSYEIGRDVAKFFMQGEAKCAQIYVPAYGTNLCVAQFPLNAYDETMFPLTITAPKEGTYTIAAENVPENVDLFLEQNGALIWNLSTSAYEINLNKGETKDYSIRWNAHSSSTPTGNNAIKSDAKVQKIFYQQNIYIIQENQMYNAQGIKVQ